MKMLKSTLNLWKVAAFVPALLLLSQTTFGQTACTLNCPGNLTVNLDPGECGKAINYSVFTSGNCPGIITANFQGQFAPSQIDAYQNDAVGPAGPNNPPFQNNYSTQFNSPTNSTLTLKSADFGFSQGPNLWYFNGVEWIVNVSTPISFNWTYTTNDGPFWDRFVMLVGSAANNFANNNFGNQVGNWQTLSNVNGAFTQTGTVNLNLVAGQRLALAAYTLDGGGGPCTVTISNFQAIGPPPQPVQTSGLPSGSVFPIGTTNNCFLLDYPGTVDDKTCCFTVTVVEFPNAVSTLVCNDLVYFSLDQDCTAPVGADDVLEGGPYGCYNNYVVELDRTAPFGNGPWTTNVAGPGDVGKTYAYRVTDPKTGNKCWGNIKFEDKIAPTLKCRDQIINCNGSPVLEPAPAITGPQYQEQKPNNPIGEPGAPIPDIQTYNFDFSYIPVGTPVLDVNVRIKLTGHTWLPDLDMRVRDPNGNEADIFTLTGCFGQEWPINVKFDDEGTGNLTLCVQLNVNGAPTQCVIAPGVSGPTVLGVAFDGKNAGGIWQVILRDNVGGDDGVTEIVGLEVTVNAPAEAPSDGCGPVTTSYTDVETPGSCATGFEKVITRTWKATDPSGNTTTCNQKISYKLPTLQDMKLPPDYDGVDAPAFSCTSNAYPTPDWIEGQGQQGYPYVFGLPVGCSIGWDYEDLVIDVCDGTYKIRRKWTVIDWCTGVDVEDNQIIKVMDNAGPAIEPVANITISTDPFTCCGITNLPDAIIEDNCSRINNISGYILGFDQYTGNPIGTFPVGGSLVDFPGNNYWDLDTLGAFGSTPCLPVGTHTVVYIAEDDCGNTTSTTFRVTVRDFVPPVAACDEYTVVGIGVDDPYDCYGPAGPQGAPTAQGACEFAGVTWVKASTFDDGSYDNCNNLKFTVRRMAPYSDCINGLNSTKVSLPAAISSPTSQVNSSVLSLSRILSSSTAARWDLLKQLSCALIRLM
jgi:hypothetical protein